MLGGYRPWRRKTVDICRRHAEIAGNIGDIRFRITVMLEQPLGRIKDAGDIFPADFVGAGGRIHGSDGFRVTCDDFHFSLVVKRKLVSVNHRQA